MSRHEGAARRADPDGATPLHAHDVTWAVDGRLIVDGIAVSAPAGALTGLIGPNGSGKSTLLRLLAGLLLADRGEVRLGEQPLARLRRREVARRVAFVDQAAATDLDLSALEVVLLGRIPHRGPFDGASDDDTAAAAAALAWVDLAGFEHRRWHTLSGGERQRVQLARALTQRPGLLLLDEPTNHLDIRHQLELLRLVRSSGLTTIAALHDLNLAAMWCDHLVVLAGGRVVAAGALATTLTRELVADLYGVDCDVAPHPRTGRPHVTVHPPVPDR